MQLKVITSDREILNTPVERVVLPGEGGMMEILPQHARLVSLLQSGEIQFSDQTKSGNIKISSGLVEIANDNICALVEI